MTTSSPAGGSRTVDLADGAVTTNQHAAHPPSHRSGVCPCPLLVPGPARAGRAQPEGLLPLVPEASHPPLRVAHCACVLSHGSPSPHVDPQDAFVSREPIAVQVDPKVILSSID